MILCIFISSSSWKQKIRTILKKRLRGKHVLTIQPSITQQLTHTWLGQMETEANLTLHRQDQGDIWCSRLVNIQMIFCWWTCISSCEAPPVNKTPLIILLISLLTLYKSFISCYNSLVKINLLPDKNWAHMYLYCWALLTHHHHHYHLYCSCCIIKCFILTGCIWTSIGIFMVWKFHSANQVMADQTIV